MSHFTNPFANDPSSTKPSSTFQTDNISNSTASTDDTSRYNICQRTGFKVKPNSLIKDPYGALVRPDSWDMRHPQEFIRPLAEELTGAIRPEGSDTFLAASISPESL